MKGRARKSTRDYADPRMRQFSNKMGEVYQEQIKKRGFPKTKKPRDSERKYGSAINRRKKDKKQIWVGGADQRFKTKSSRLKSDTRVGRPHGKKSYMDIVREKRNKIKEGGTNQQGLGLSISKDAGELQYLEQGYEKRDFGGRVEMYRPYQGTGVEGIHKKKMQSSNTYASVDWDKMDVQVNVKPRSGSKPTGKSKVKRTRLGYKVARQRKVDSIMKMLDTETDDAQKKGYLTKERERNEINGGRKTTPRTKKRNSDPGKTDHESKPRHFSQAFIFQGI